jgi:hypothetical protein
MGMTLQNLSDGNVRVTQKIQRPLVYLDHWAIRLFSENLPLQDRFVTALHQAGGTLIFSTANLFEYVAMTDINQAVEAEKLLFRILPSLYVVDVAFDMEGFGSNDSTILSQAPIKNWLLDDLAQRAIIAGGHWNMHRFVQDAIKQRDKLLPVFNDMKVSVAEAVMSLTKDANKTKFAKNFVPKAGMTLRDALFHEFLREPHVNPSYIFDGNDAMDIIHAVPAALVCDFVLLDARWCHRLKSATVRIKKAGIKGKIGRSFEMKSIANFLSILESEAKDIFT